MENLSSRHGISKLPILCMQRRNHMHVKLKESLSQNQICKITFEYILGRNHIPVKFMERRLTRQALSKHTLLYTPVKKHTSGN